MTPTTPISTTTMAATLAAATITSCSTVTGGTPAPPHIGTSASATAAAPSNSPAGPPSPTTVSPQDQIRQTLMAFADAVNSQNWDAYTELMCSAMRAQFTGPVMDYLKKSRAESGMTAVTAITSIVITGDRATATLTTQNEAMGTRSVTLPLKLEDGWKICQT
jgi:hypothetical protein